MAKHECRACRGKAAIWCSIWVSSPHVTTSRQYDDPGPDPVYPLQMWLCSRCGLAQLLTDPTVPEEPKGAEPAALVAQAEDAVRPVAAAGLLPAAAGWLSTAARTAAPGWGCWPTGPPARGRHGRGRCHPRLLRHDARCRPGRPRSPTGRPAGTRRSPAPAVSLPRYDHPAGPVERAAARSLRLLLHDRALAQCSPPSASARARPGLRPLRRHRAARRRAATLTTIPDHAPTRRSGPSRR